MTTPRSAFTLFELLIVVTIITILATLTFAGLRMVRDSAQAVACLSNQRQIGLAIATYGMDHRGLIPPTILLNTNLGVLGIKHYGKWFGFLEAYVPDFENSPVFMCPQWIRRADTIINPDWALHNLYSVSYGYSFWTQEVVLGRDQWHWRVQVNAPAHTALLAEKWGVNGSGTYSSEPAVWPNWGGNGAQAAFGDRPVAPTEAGAGESSQRFSHKRRSNVLFYDMRAASVTFKESGIAQHDTPNIWEGR